MSLNLLLNKTIDKADSDILRQYISNGLRELSTYITLDDDIFDLLKNKNDSNYRLDLDRIFNEIKSNQNLGVHYQNAFVAVPINFKDTKNISKMLIMQARLWGAAFPLIQLSGYQGEIKRAFDEFRLLAFKKDLEQLKNLPNFKLSNLELIDALVKAKKESTESIARRIQHYISLIRSTIERSPVYKVRNSTTKDIVVKKKEVKVKLSSMIALEPNESIVEQFIGVYDDANNESPRDEETIFDKPITAQYISVIHSNKTNVNYSMLRQIQQSKATINAIQKRDKKLITETGSLTNFEINKLILNTDYSSKNNSPIYALILLSLFSGRSIEKLIQHIKDKELEHDGYQYHLSEMIKFPSHEFSDIEQKNGKIITKLELETLVDRSGNKINLSYPSLITKADIKIGLDEILKKSSELLIKINNKWGTRITLAKTQNHYAFYMQNNAIDIAEQTLLIGHDFQKTSANYYYQIFIQRLAVTNDVFQKKLLETIIPGELTKLDNTYSTVTIGSQLQLKLNILSQLLSMLKGFFKSTNSYSLDNFELFHNLYTVYVMYILNLSTGYRAVNDPFDDITYFDLINNTVIIDDKNVRGRLAVRICKLPPSTVKQIKEYLLHLDRLSAFIMPIDNQLGQTLQEIKNGERPLFSFLKNNKIVRATQRRIEIEIQQILPIPSNWHRHLLRTFLINNDIAAEVVDAFMGHSPVGDISFEKYSGLSLAQLKVVADVIENNLFTVLGVSVTKGWGK